MIGLIFVGLVCIFSGSLMCYMGVDMIVSAPALSGWDAIGSFAGGIGTIILGTAFFVCFSMLGKIMIAMVKEKLK